MNNGCWEWIASINHGGYGLFKFNNKMIITHRFIYEYYHGSICPDLTIDHLCRNRKCVNPVHLEQVTQQVNISRGNTGKHHNHYNKFKTHCPQGHPYSEENTYRFKNSRKCKTCVSNRITQKPFLGRNFT